jgi:peptide/nickel transport system ATP-binding protein
VTSGDPLLVVRDLHTRFDTPEGPLRPVDGVSFELSRGATLGVVGESGSGKTMTGLSILRLLPASGRIESGSIDFDGRNLLTLPEREMRALRGKRIAMVFQEPMTALNPVYSVARQIGEVLSLHEGMGRAAARARSIELLRVVGIPDPERRVDSYPHELSGGMRQRVMIAMAIACSPQLLIADEPTTALDVTIQAQILELLLRLRRELGMAVLLITHDLGVVAEFAEEVLVMYAGTVVERAKAHDLFTAPLHPYTQGLLASAPQRPGSVVTRGGQRRLATIAGVVPDLAHLPGGCRFRERCDRAIARCAEAEPPLSESGERRKVACFVAMEHLTRRSP